MTSITGLHNLEVTDQNLLDFIFLHHQVEILDDTECEANMYRTWSNVIQRLKRQSRIHAYRRDFGHYYEVVILELTEPQRELMHIQRAVNG